MNDYWASHRSKIKNYKNIKEHQRNDYIDRTVGYMDKHREFSRKCLMFDIDSVEIRIDRNYEDGIRYAAIIELTQAAMGKDVNENYLANILKRFNSRDLQGKFIRNVAKRFNTNVHIVLFRENLEEYWVHNLSCGGSWVHTDEKNYREWIERL